MSLANSKIATTLTDMGKKSKLECMANLWECTETIHNNCHSGGSQYSQRPLTVADLSTGQGLNKNGFNLRLCLYALPV